MIRTRFAPSPTGFLHVGGARTALFNFLYSKHEKGTFVLRIEDTDIERSTIESENQLIDAMTWLGLDWDEGPKLEGEYGPYRQSERKEIYREKATELIERGKAYEAYIYPEEMDKIKEDLLSQGKPPHFTEEMITQFNSEERKEEYMKKYKHPVVFFKMPRKDYVLDDLIKGEVTFKNGAVGDFILIRSNGLPTYNFAVVVDDMMMEISHVVRGDDHLSNTLRQMAVYEAFDVELPDFAHVSMILGPDGKKLSKRHGATSAEEFRNRGYLPEAVLNYLALLGWSHPEGKEILTINEIIENFTFDRVNSSPAVFDEKKLKWMNGNYIRNADTDRIFKLSIPFITKAEVLSEAQCEDNKKWLKEAIELVKTSIEELSEVPGEISIFINNFTPELENEEFIEYLKADGVKEALRIALEKFNNDTDWTVQTVLENLKVAMKDAKPAKKPFYMALRKALTNQFHGPDLVKAVHLIGRARAIERLEMVIENEY